MQATISWKHITKGATTLYQSLQLFDIYLFWAISVKHDYLVISFFEHVRKVRTFSSLMIKCILCAFKTNKHLCVRTVRILPVDVWVEKYYLVKNVISHLWLTGTCIYWFQCVGFTSQSTDSLVLVWFLYLNLVLHLTVFTCSWYGNKTLLFAETLSRIWQNDCCSPKTIISSALCNTIYPQISSISVGIEGKMKKKLLLNMHHRKWLQD